MAAPDEWAGRADSPGTGSQWAVRAGPPGTGGR